MKSTKSKSLILALLASAFVFAGCTEKNVSVNELVQPTAHGNTELVKETTELPTSEPSEAPTSDPTDAPKTSDAFPIELGSNDAINIDIDFDGSIDTILFAEKKLENDESNYKLTVTRGAEGSAPFEYEIASGKSARLIVLDCDPNDSRLDILLSWDQHSDDPASLICRVTEDGSGMFTQHGLCYFDISDTSLNAGEFKISAHTNLLSADFQNAIATVDASGMKLVDDFKFTNSGLSDEYWMNTQSLKREMKVRILNDDGSIGNEVTVPAGDHIVPVSTDFESYVNVMLSDGSIGRLELSFGSDGRYPIYLNGVVQDDYFTEPFIYAG